MRLLLRQFGLAAGLGGLLLAGCGDKSAVHKQLRDPLFTSKKPVEGKPDAGGPALAVQYEPLPPQAPPTGLASVPVVTDGIAAARAEQKREQPQPKPVEAVPAVRQGGGSVPPPVEPAVRRQGMYDHAPDHSWLVGVLDKHYHGHFNLRYCDHATDDDWGGKVILEDDPRLGQFKDGDRVRVEGEIVREDGKAVRGTWNHFPRYRVKTVERVD